MDLGPIAARVAGLTQPLTERPDHGSGDRSAGYLDEPVDVKHPDRLVDWFNTPDGKDLMHLVGQLSKLVPDKAWDMRRIKKDSPELPHILKKLSNSALEVLDYVKS